MIAVLIVGAIVGIAMERFLSRKRRQAWRHRNHWRWQRRWGGDNVANGPWGFQLDKMESKQPDAADQLRIVMAASFTISANPQQERSANSSKSSTVLSLIATPLGR